MFNTGGSSAIYGNITPFMAKQFQMSVWNDKIIMQKTGNHLLENQIVFGG